MIRVINNTFYIFNKPIIVTYKENYIYIDNSANLYVFDHEISESEKESLSNRDVFLILKINILDWDNFSYSIDSYIFLKKELLNNVEYMFIPKSTLSNARLWSGPLYNPGGMPNVLAAYAEGVPFDFDYESFYASTVVLTTYIWTGGRACFDSLFFGVYSANNTLPSYTAIPLLPCATLTPLIELELAVDIIVPSGLGGYSAIMSDAYNYVMNMFSLVVSQFHYRRYTQISLNSNNSFSFYLDKGKVDINFNNVDASNETVSVFSSKFSMFNLMQ